MRPVDPRLFRYARAARVALAVCIALGLMWAGLVIAQASFLADGITAVFPGGGSLTAAVIGLVVVVAARALVAWGQEVAAHRAAAAARSQLRERLLHHVVGLGPGWLTGERSGELSTLATRGVDALDGYFARYLPQLVLAALVPVVIAVRVLGADVIAGLTIVVTLPLIPFFMALVGRGTSAANRRQFRYLERLSHHFLDVVAGLATLRVFGRARAQATTIATVSAEYRRLTMRSLRLAFLSGLVLELLATISVALVAVGVGLRLVSGSLDLHTALLALILAPEAYLPLRALGSQFHASAEGLAAAEEVFTVLAVPLPAPASAIATGGGVSLDRVTVSYPDRATPALVDCSLTVSPGEIVALTGPSGVGKSTILAVLLGFVQPARGRVLIGDRDLSEVDVERWRERVAWLPQSPTLFTGTVIDQAGGLSELIDDLDGRSLGEGGHGVSAGQRQRIALARALARARAGADILLLDEPTAHLDEAREAQAIAAIRVAAVGRTVLLIAHRPALLALADRVVVLADAEASVA